MRKLNKTAACGILAAALAAGTLSGCSKAIDGTKTVATVGDEKVTLGLASYMTRDQQAQTMSYYNMLMSQYGVSGSASNVWDQKGDDGKTVGESSKDGVMKTINQLYVLKAHAADYDVTITDDEEKAIKEAAAEFIKDNDEKILKKLAVSEDDIVTYLELVTIRSKMHDPMTADVDTEVSANEKDQTRVTIVKVSTEGTEKDDDGNTIDLTDEEKAQKNGQSSHPRRRRSVEMPGAGGSRLPGHVDGPHLQRQLLGQRRGQQRNRKGHQQGHCRGHRSRMNRDDRGSLLNGPQSPLSCILCAGSCWRYSPPSQPRPGRPTPGTPYPPAGG